MKIPVLLLSLGFLALPLAGSAESQGHQEAEKYFTDTKLINQDGKVMRFYSDLVKDRSVVINTFFTSCTGICPPLNRRMAQIQERYGDRLGQDMLMISISVDPEHDTPPRLREYAKRYHARPGWYFLTGPKQNVELILRKLGHLVEDPDDHTGILLIGNDKTELWKKAQGFARSEDVLAVVDSVVSEP